MARARTTPPTSGETMQRSLLPVEALLDVLDQDRRGEQIVGRNVEEPLDLPGMQIEVSTRSAPAVVIRLATSLAEIGERGPDLRSCLA